MRLSSGQAPSQSSLPPVPTVPPQPASHTGRQCLSPQVPECVPKCTTEGYKILVDDMQTILKKKKKSSIYFKEYQKLDWYR